MLDTRTWSPQGTEHPHLSYEVHKVHWKSHETLLNLSELYLDQKCELEKKINYGIIPGKKQKLKNLKPLGGNSISHPTAG